jgi:hypothetical protein
VRAREGDRRRQGGPTGQREGERGKKEQVREGADRRGSPVREGWRAGTGARGGWADLVRNAVFYFP